MEYYVKLWGVLCLKIYIMYFLVKRLNSKHMFVILVLGGSYERENYFTYRL